MITIKDSVLDVESVKKELSEDRHCFQNFKLEADHSLYPIDYNDTSGEIFKFCIDDKIIPLEYEAIIYGDDKTIHVFQGIVFELLIIIQNDDYSFEMHSLGKSILQEK